MTDSLFASWIIQNKNSDPNTRRNSIKFALFFKLICDVWVHCTSKNDHTKVLAALTWWNRRACCTSSKTQASHESSLKMESLMQPLQLHLGDGNKAPTITPEKKVGSDSDRENTMDTLGSTINPYIQRSGAASSKWRRRHFFRPKIRKIHP